MANYTLIPLALRKRHPISMVKAKEALSKSNLNVDEALLWLERDLHAGGAAKQAKLAGRVAAEGLIAVGVMGEGWGRRGGIVEVSQPTACELTRVAPGREANGRLVCLDLTDNLVVPPSYSSSTVRPRSCTERLGSRTCFRTCTTHLPSSTTHPPSRPRLRTTRPTSRPHTWSTSTPVPSSRPRSCRPTRHPRTPTLN